MSSIVRKVWNALSMLSCAVALVLLFTSDATSVLTAVGAGATFFFLGNYVSHDDLDVG